jgi:hypothetical protein
MYLFILRVSIVMPNALGYLFLFKQKIVKRINMPLISNELVTALPLSWDVWPREVSRNSVRKKFDRTIAAYTL